jgi:CheY-like chemotaxis protein
MGLSRGPLGIIALFIVLVYGLAALVTAFSSAFTPNERLPLIYFLVSFPVLVLIVFAWLVSAHAAKLYPPSDYKNEENFVAVVASLAAANAKRLEGGDTPETPKRTDIRRIAETVRKVAPHELSDRDSHHNHVLWVDDRPQNNTFERQAFEAVGVRFTLALSTEQALSLAGQNKFAAIISDMGRREGPREGYALLDALRQSGDKTPLFFYAGSAEPQHRRETAEHDGQGCTNDPQELFEMVTSALIRRGHS